MKIGLLIASRRGELGFAAIAFGICRRPSDFDDMAATTFAGLAKAFRRRIVVRLPLHTRGVLKRGAA